MIYYLKIHPMIRNRHPDIYPSEWVSLSSLSSNYQHLGNADIAIKSENGKHLYVKHREFFDYKNTKVDEDMVFIALSSSNLD